MSKKSHKLPKLEDFQKVCVSKNGILASVAQVFGVERLTIYNWCEKYPEYKEAVNSSREVFLDIAETNLQTLVKGVPLYKEEDGKKIFKRWIKEPSESAIIFVLRTIGKKRGYVERTEQDINATGNVVLNFANAPLTQKDIEEINRIKNGA